MRRIKLFEEFNEEAGGDEHASDVAVYLKEILDKPESWTISGAKGYSDELGTFEKTTTFRNDERGLDIDVKWTDTLKKGRFGPEEDTGYGGDQETETTLEEVILFTGDGNEEYPVIANDEIESLFFKIQDKLNK